MKDSTSCTINLLAEATKMKETDGSDFVYMLLQCQFLSQLDSRLVHDLDWLNDFRCNVDMKHCQYHLLWTLTMDVS